MERTSIIKHNIICNNCVGARMYEVSKQQFPNPFMWSALLCDDFIELVETWDKLNLKNVKFSLENYKKNTYKSVLVKIEDKIDVHFVHYIEDADKRVPTKELSTNIVYYNIINYANEKWFNRVERIKQEPVFLYSFNYYDKEDKKNMKTIFLN